MRTLPSEFKQVSDLDEIIFAHRNKSYGAYELRKHYHERLLKAFMIAASFSLLSMLIISFVLQLEPREIIIDAFSTNRDTITNVVIEEKKVQQAQMHRKQSDPELPRTVIMNDTVREQKEKVDTTKVTASLGNTSLHGYTTSNNDNSVGKGITLDTVSTENNDGQSIRKTADVMPSFPGGDKAFSKYIQRHFDCNSSTIPGETTEGKIVLRFVVMRDSSIKNIEVLRSNVGPDCLNRAKNILLNSPKWNPGIYHDLPVNVQLVLPITIVLQ